MYIYSACAHLDLHKHGLNPCSFGLDSRPKVQRFRTFGKGATATYNV